jgi:hypothetical protein
MDFLKALGDVNALAVMVGALAAFALGAVWYSPALFSKQWMKELGIKKTADSNKKMKEELPKLMAVSLALTVVLAIALAMLMNLLSTSGFWNGAAVGAFVGLFVAGVITAINYVYEKRTLTLWSINAGYQVAMCMAIGVVIGVWPR